MAASAFNRGKYLFASGGITGSTDIRCLLVKSTYTFAATQNTVADAISGSQEISVSGYSRYDHASITITEDDGNNRAYLDLDDAVFTALAAGQTVGGAVLYVYNAADASANLIAYYPTSATPTNGGNISIAWAAPGSGAAINLS